MRGTDGAVLSQVQPFLNDIVTGNEDLLWNISRSLMLL